MDDKTLDHILATDDELLPSSGFVEAVMTRIQQEAAAPAPLPFPWKRVLPGMVAAAGGLVWVAVSFGKEMATAVHSPELHAAHAQTFTIPFSLQNAGWITLALGASLLSWSFARRIAGRSGLL
ncbi:MAG TPA: hypothetical protein VF392_13075 [Terracidiphilus sp.]